MGLIIDLCVFLGKLFFVFLFCFNVLEQLRKDIDVIIIIGDQKKNLLINKCKL